MTVTRRLPFFIWAIFNRCDRAGEAGCLLSLVTVLIPRACASTVRRETGMTLTSTANLPPTGAATGTAEPSATSESSSTPQPVGR
jgi:hypothetical protein